MKYDSVGATDKSVEKLRNKAASQGASVVIPDPNELFIDIDSAAHLNRYRDAIHEITTDNNGIWSFRIRNTTTSKSGMPHQHVVLTLPEDLAGRIKPSRVQILARIALQYFFGSDPRCENMNVRRALAGHPVPICFFDPITPSPKSPRNPPAMSSKAKDPSPSNDSNNTRLGIAPRRTTVSCSKITFGALNSNPTPTSGTNSAGPCSVS